MQVEFHACVVPQPPAGGQRYVLCCIRDPKFAVTLIDKSESLARSRTEIKDRTFLGKYYQPNLCLFCLFDSGKIFNLSHVGRLEVNLMIEMRRIHDVDNEANQESQRIEYYK